MERCIAIAKRMMHPRIEALEGRALLSNFGVSLTTNMVVYQPGQPLSNTAGFTLSRGSTVIWRSHGTKVSARAVQSLAPGQSIEIHGIWMGNPNQRRVKALMPGLYQVEGSAGGYTADVTIRIKA